MGKFTAMQATMPDDPAETDSPEGMRLAKPTANLRLFVAVYPPPEAVRRMLDALAAMALPAGSRAAPPAQVHMTVQFIGDRPARELDAVIESVERSAAGLRGFTLAAKRLISLPQRGPARLVAAETDAPATLLELHRRLAARLAKAARADAADRFLPHVTLCRFPAPVRDFAIDRPLELPPFAIGRVALVRSTLGPAGASHREVAGFALGA